MAFWRPFFITCFYMVSIWLANDWSFFVSWSASCHASSWLCRLKSSSCFSRSSNVIAAAPEGARGCADTSRRAMVQDRKVIDDVQRLRPSLLLAPAPPASTAVLVADGVPRRHAPNSVHYQQRRGHNQASWCDEEDLGRVPNHVVGARREPVEHHAAAAQD
ncbi:unnamed protein product [Prorocentrum cordatum]|uniref:Secreted protein n=1 Tax=Prorocentrum cordatum TaxID=2364126 RepID=A0ABN9QW48_9DINO|nr:unnamed protein product [Polarella glacialis]